MRYMSNCTILSEFLELINLMFFLHLLCMIMLVDMKSGQNVEKNLEYNE